jgi:hypothetical protein
VLDDAGSVRIDPPGMGRACEARRRRIRQLVARLVDAGQAPLFDDAVRFERAEEAAETNNVIHRQARAVQNLVDVLGEPVLPDQWPGDAFCFEIVSVAQRARLTPPESPGGRRIDLEARWRMSDWDFDRIMYAQFLENLLRKRPDADVARRAIEFAEAELDRAIAHPPTPTAANQGTDRADTAITMLCHALGPLRLMDEAAAAPHVQRIAELADRLEALGARGPGNERVQTAAKRLRERVRVDASPADGPVHPVIRAVQ